MEYLSKHNSRRGNMVVGAALMFPLLVLLTFALIEYGWIFIKSQEIRNAARHGARVGARIDAANADVVNAIDVLMGDAEIIGYTVTITPADITAMDIGDTLTVTVNVPYDGEDVELLDIPLVPVPADLGASVSMAKEGT